MTAGTTLVTGATGFAGTHLLRSLPSPAGIIAWHRPGGTPPSRGPATWRAVDLGERDGVRDAIRNDAPSRVFHLGGASRVDTSFTNGVPHLRANALGTHHLLESVRTSLPECRVLAVTSALIYGDQEAPIGEDAPLAPASPYGLSKLAADVIARAAAADGVDVVIARPFNHIGPGQDAGFALPSFARQIARIEAGLSPPVVDVGDMDTRRDLTDVRDVVRAYALLMERGQPGRAYNVCSGRAVRIGDLLDILIGLAEVKVTIRVDPARIRPRELRTVQGDPARIRGEVGWAPEIPIDQTLAELLAFWREDVQRSP